MINEKDIQISNKSYTNKQFSTIYPELIDLSKKLGDKWDAENTNESDPAIVLTKLMAFIADKNNYNIDKNVLENFMPSCTQESSMRALCEANAEDRGALKAKGLLRRDPRMVERKKPGQKKARKRFQFSKR